MDVTDESDVALIELGAVLASAKWVPSKPIVKPFADDHDPSYLKILATRFFVQYQLKLRSLLCDGGECKAGIQTASDIGAAIGDWLLAISGNLPVVTVANCLAKYGVNRFCKSTYQA